jgi:hypothetical protein
LGNFFVCFLACLLFFVLFYCFLLFFGSHTWVTTPTISIQFLSTSSDYFSYHPPNFYFLFVHN